MQLTNDARKLLYLLYKEYRRRRGAGMDRATALDFRSAHTVRELLAPEESEADVLDCLLELRRGGYVGGLDADNTLYTCRLTPDAVAAMEQMPKETFLSVTDFLAKFIP